MTPHTALQQSDSDIEATIKKHQEEMTRLMKEGDPKFVELYDKNATLVNGKVMRGFVGREAIAEILKPHLKQDMKVSVRKPSLVDLDVPCFVAFRTVPVRYGIHYSTGPLRVSVPYRSHAVRHTGRHRTLAANSLVRP